MTVRVVYATKYGGTRAIAESIAQTLQGCGVDAFARSVASGADLSKYEGVVVGSALYMGSWMKAAVAFAQKNQEVLASRPVWLFSSGPLGTATTDTEHHDVRESAAPKQLPDLLETLHARDHRVFFGISDHTHFDFRDRLIYTLPAGKKLLIDGDFRDRSEIEAWAKDIAHALAPVPA